MVTVSVLYDHRWSRPPSRHPSNCRRPTRGAVDYTMSREEWWAHEATTRLGLSPIRLSAARLCHGNRPRITATMTPGTSWICARGWALPSHPTPAWRRSCYLFFFLGLPTTHSCN